MADEPDVLVCETGPRDGLQNLPMVLPTEVKTALIDMIAAAGVREIDAASFVPPRNVPQFVDADTVVAHALAHTGATIGAVVPNVRGAERALAAGVHAIYFVLSASRGHNRANVNTTPEAQVEAFRIVRANADEVDATRRPRLVAAIATAFGCSIDGRIDPDEVRRLAALLVEAGADELAVADTVGYGNPAQVKALSAALLTDLAGAVPLRLHLHDTLGMGLANAFAGLEAGVRRFDAAVSGLGGCPFAPGARGNIVTEDLVFMLHELGLSTGIDLAKLMETRALLAAHIPAKHLTGRIHEAGIPAALARAA